MKRDDQDAWTRLLGEAKKSGAGQPGRRETGDPSSFVVRMRTARENLWVFAKTILWRRWSLIAIAVALLLYLIAYLVLGPAAPPSIPTPDPPRPLTP